MILAAFRSEGRIIDCSSSEESDAAVCTTQPEMVDLFITVSRSCSETSCELWRKGGVEEARD